MHCYESILCIINKLGNQWDDLTFSKLHPPNPLRMIHSCHSLRSRPHARHNLPNPLATLKYFQLFSNQWTFSERHWHHHYSGVFLQGGGWPYNCRLRYGPLSILPGATSRLDFVHIAWWTICRRFLRQHKVVESYGCLGNQFHITPFACNIRLKRTPPCNEDSKGVFYDSTSTQKPK